MSVVDLIVVDLINVLSRFHGDDPVIVDGDVRVFGSPKGQDSPGARSRGVAVVVAGRPAELVRQADGSHRLRLPSRETARDVPPDPPPPPAGETGGAVEGVPGRGS